MGIAKRITGAAISTTYGKSSEKGKCNVPDNLTPQDCLQSEPFLHQLSNAAQHASEVEGINTFWKRAYEQLADALLNFADGFSIFILKWPTT